MTPEASFSSLDSLQADIAELIDRLPTLKHRQFIQQSLTTILRLADSDIERLDWKILSAALADMECGFQLFYNDLFSMTRPVCVVESQNTDLAMICLATQEINSPDRHEINILVKN